jgi:hypothetical protein
VSVLWKPGKKVSQLCRKRVTEQSSTTVFCPVWHSVAVTLQKQRSPADERQHTLLPCGVHLSTVLPALLLPFEHSQSGAPAVVVVEHERVVQEQAPLPFARYASSAQQSAGEPTEAVEQGSVVLPLPGVQSHVPEAVTQPNVARAPPPSEVEEEEEEQATKTARAEKGRRKSLIVGSGLAPRKRRIRIPDSSFNPRAARA